MPRKKKPADPLESDFGPGVAAEPEKAAPESGGAPRARR